MLSHRGDKSELRGATPDFLPLAGSRTGLFTRRFHLSFRDRIFFRLMATLTGFFRYTRVSPLQGAAHCLALPPVVPTCRGGSAWLLLPALRRRRERLLLRPEVPYLFERFASCRPLHLAVSASPGPSRGAGRYPRQVSLSVQALHAGRLEVLTDFMHRGDRGQNSTMKLSRSFSCGAVPLPRFVIVS